MSWLLLNRNRACERNCSPARPRRNNFLRQIAIGSDHSGLFYDPLILFERTFDPVHAIAVSIGHPSEDLVGARSSVSKKHVRNARHDFASVELVHRPHPPISNIPRVLALGGIYDQIRERLGLLLVSGLKGAASCCRASSADRWVPGTSHFSSVASNNPSAFITCSYRP